MSSLTSCSQNKVLILAALLLPAIGCSSGFAQESSAPPSAEDIAKKLANPIASLISVPLQFNWDDNFGSDDGGSLFKLNVQPVIPMSISDDWNLISRTILQIVYQDGFPFSDYNEFGLSDTVRCQ